MKEETLHGSLTFLGFVISVIAVFYFAVEYIPLVSDWTRVAALVLLAVMFGFVGAYLRQTVIGRPFFSGPRLNWLRPPVVMYLSAIVAGVSAEIAFLGIDEIQVPIKILISLVIGIGLIVVVARRMQKDEGEDERPPAGS